MCHDLILKQNPIWAKCFLKMIKMTHLKHVLKLINVAQNCRHNHGKFHFRDANFKHFPGGMPSDSPRNADPQHV